MDFEAQTTGMPRCVSGSVAAQADFGGTAILGYNLNEGAGSTAMAIAQTKAGVSISISNNAGSALRLQVQTASTGGTQWCTPLLGTGGFIPWENLRTNCWAAGGAKYNREPVVSAMVLVPGKDMVAVPFDFCVNTLAEADAPATGGMAGAGSAGTMAAGTGGAAGDGVAGDGAAGDGAAGDGAAGAGSGT
jgi:hypothetical protein